MAKYILYFPTTVANNSFQLMIQPNLITTLTVPSTKLTKQSNCTSGRKKTNSLAAISYRRKDEVVTSVSKNSVLIVPRGQPAQRDVSSDSSSNIVTDVSDSNGGRKSNRRKSFTSLLMARSQVEAFSFFLSTPLLFRGFQIPFFLVAATRRTCWVYETRKFAEYLWWWQSPWSCWICWWDLSVLLDFGGHFISHSDSLWLFHSVLQLSR